MLEYTKKVVDIHSTKKQLQKLILNNGLKWAEGTNRAGNQTKWMFDLREVILTPGGSKLVAMLIYEKIKDLEFDMIGGPSIAAEPLVTALIMHCYSNDKYVSGFIIRKNPNEFGLRKKVEGPIRNGKRVVLVDDAINSGSKLLDSVTTLEKEGCNVIKIITILDFCKSGHEKFKENGYHIDYIFNLKDFGLETNKLYKYKKISKLSEIKITEGKETILKKLNEVLNEEILDFKEYKNLILVAYKEGSVYCFDQNNYSIKWKLKLGESISAPLFIDENGVAIISVSSALKRSILFFISIKNGTILTNIKIKGVIYSTPLSYKDLYIIGSYNRKLYCINKKSKKIIWTFETNDSIRTNPVIDKATEIIYLNSNDGNTYALNLNGELIWKKHLGSNLVTNPIIYQNSIIINSDINVIFCLDKRNGSLIWFQELKNQAYDLKIISDEVVVGCSHGYVLFFDCFTGVNLGSMKISDKDIINLDKRQNKILIELDDGKHYLIQI